MHYIYRVLERSPTTPTPTPTGIKMTPHIEYSPLWCRGSRIVIVIISTSTIVIQSLSHSSTTSIVIIIIISMVYWSISIDPSCTADFEQRDGTVKQVVSSRDEMRKLFENDFRENQSVIVKSLTRITDSTSSSSIPYHLERTSCCTCIDSYCTSTGKYVDVTYYMRENDMVHMPRLF